MNNYLTSTIRADATRYLCAGVFFDREFRNLVIRQVHNDTAHRTAPSYGFDLVTVIRKAWQAWIQEVAQLAALAAVLAVTFDVDFRAVILAACGLGIVYLTWVWLRAAPETIWLHTVAASERLLRRRGMVDHGRRRERGRLVLLCLGGSAALAVIAAWAAGSTQQPSQQFTAAAYLLGALAVVAACAGIARQVALNRIRWRPVLRPGSPAGRLGVIQAQQESAYVVYRRPVSEKDPRERLDAGSFYEVTPFVGSGILVHRWLPPLNVQLMRPGHGSLAAREYRQPPFKAHELVTFLKDAMSPAGEEPGPMQGFRIKDRLYIAETDLPPYRLFLRTPTAQEDIDAVIDDPNGPVQHFLEIQLTVSGELVTTAFVRISVRGRSLSVDFAACALTRTPSEYHLLDSWGETGLLAIVRSALHSIGTIPATLGGLWRLAEIPWMLRAISSTRDRTLYPRRRAGIGTRLSIREEKTADWDEASLDKTAIFDDVKIIEQRLLKATEDFLESRDVDVSVLRRRAMSIISTGILNMGGNLSVNNTNVGNGASINVNDKTDDNAA
jgi:hypothetical protein